VRGREREIKKWRQGKREVFSKRYREKDGSGRYI
jgi:hypothetical protein